MKHWQFHWSALDADDTFDSPALSSGSSFHVGLDALAVRDLAGGNFALALPSSLLNGRNSILSPSLGSQLHGVSSLTPLSAGAQAVLNSTKGGALSVLDSHLAALAIEQGPHAAELSFFTAGAGQIAGALAHDAQGTEYVLIDTTAKDGNGAALLNHLEHLGLVNGSSFHGVASGYLPIDELNALTRIVDLGHASESMFSLNTGSVNTQADDALGADTARVDYSVDGTGLKVGILSDSFNTSGNADTTTTDIASGDLPADTTVLQEDTFPGGEDEGRGMAQLVHDLAPGASILFATAEGGQAAFANNILALATAGAKIIVDDVSYYEEPAYQDGVIAQAISQVVSQGVSYFTSAANNGLEGWEGAWVSGGTGTINGFGETFMQFAPGQDYLPIVLADQESIILQWDQPAASATTGGAGSQVDLDIEITDASGNTVYAFQASNNIGGDPVEELDLQNGAGGTYYLRVGLYTGDPNHVTPPTEIKLMALGNGRPVDLGTTATNTNNGTVYGHAGSSDAISVAASGYSQTPFFGTTPPGVEFFSSGGPTTLWYDTAGNRYATAQIHHNPQITSVDGGNTTFFGQDDGFDSDTNPNFYGTSAAAPDAAAVAALMLQANSQLTRADILNLMQDSAQDMGTAGYDDRTGAGLLRADLAVGFAKTLIISEDALHIGTLYGTHLADTIHPLEAGGVVSAGDGDDSIVFDAVALNASEQIDGGNGTDTVRLNGDYTAGNALTFGASSLANVEGITVAAGHSYDITSNNANVGAGQTLTVNGQSLLSSDSLTFNGAAETDGTFVLMGGAGNDTLTGGAGNDTLYNIGGTDTLKGGDGDDTYVVDGAVATIVEGLNKGHDTVDTTLVSYVLPSNVEDLTYTGSGNFIGTGNTLTNLIVGGAGNDTLNGGGGTDMLIGSSGNDTYIVNNAGVTVDELSGAGTGTDLVKTTLSSYTLDANVENLTYTSTGNFSGTGNTLANTITGNSGNDTLNGGGGADHLVGKAGNDIYIIDNTGVTVTEASGAANGTDTVKTSLLSSYTLGANIENLIYTGTGHFTGTGNTLVNSISGGAGADTLNGGGGADHLVGKGGNDTYIVGNTGVVITEVAAGGTDTVKTTLASYTLGNNLENLTYTGTGSFTGTGNALANTITGGAKADILNGGGGADHLNGGAGADHFVYGSAAVSTGTGHDTITGFDALSDKIDVTGTITGINTAITTGALSNATFDANLATAVNAAHLGAHHAVEFTASAGTLKGDHFLIVDLNGTAGYQANADLVIQLSSPANMNHLSTGDFI